MACVRAISLTFVFKPSYSHGSCRDQGDGVGAAAPVDSGTIGLIGMFSNIFVSATVTTALVCLPTQSITRQGDR